MRAATRCSCARSSLWQRPSTSDYTVHLRRQGDRGLWSFEVSVPWDRHSVNLPDFDIRNVTLLQAVSIDEFQRAERGLEVVGVCTSCG